MKKKKEMQENEREIQNELDKYWGQQDRIEKLLMWLVVHQKMVEMLLESIEEIKVIPSKWAKLLKQLPDISDILKEKKENEKR